MGDQGFVNLGPCVFIFETSSQQVKLILQKGVGRLEDSCKVPSGFYFEFAQAFWT